jgi:4-hydroxymandelate oxidase
LTINSSSYNQICQNDRHVHGFRILWPLRPAINQLGIYLEVSAENVRNRSQGGPQLDTAPATIEVLPEIVAAADGRLEVIVDRGIPRKTDMLKAIAGGARAAGMGWPLIWGQLITRNKTNL